MTSRDRVLAAFRALTRKGGGETVPEECLRLAFELYAAEQEEADLCARRISNDRIKNVSGFNAATESPYHALSRYMEQVVTRDEEFSWHVAIKRMWNNHRYFERQRTGEVPFEDHLSDGGLVPLSIPTESDSEGGSQLLRFGERPHMATWAQLTGSGASRVSGTTPQRENSPIGPMAMRFVLLQRHQPAST